MARKATTLDLGDFPDLDAPPRRRRLRLRRRRPGQLPSLIWICLRPHRRTITLFVISLLAQSSVSVRMIDLLVKMVDEGVVDRSRPLSEFVSEGLTIAALTAIFSVPTGYLIRKLQFVVELDLRTWLYLRLQAADLGNLGKMTSGQLVSRSIADLNFVQQVIGIIPVLVALVPIILGGAIYLTIINPLMGGTASVALIINIVLVNRINPRLQALSAAELNERAEVTVAIDEPVRGIRVVHAFGTEEHEARRVEAAALQVYRWAMSRARLLARFELVLRSLPVVVNASMLYVGARLVDDGNLTLGTFTLAFTLVTAFSALSAALNNVVSLWQYFRAAQRRLTQVLRLPQARTGSSSAPSGAHDLHIAGVTVERGGRAVLRGFDLHAPAGAITFVEGAPGSGKTTVAGIAAGIIDPAQGSVTIGGVPVADLAPAEAGKAVRVVAEESFLFAGTVRSNLAMGCTSGSCTDDDLHRALWAAGAEDVVADLPGGLDSPIGERGLTLSGGQRQRIALARALVSPPRVLVLDDALSAVQPALEVAVLRRIREHDPELALVVVTRRGDPTGIADVTCTLPEPERGATVAPTGPSEVDLLLDDPSAPGIGLPAAALAELQRLGAAIAEADDPPPVGDQQLGGLAPPTVRTTLVEPFRRVLVITSLVLLVLAAGEVIPKLVLGNVSDLARDHELGAIDVRIAGLAVVAVAAALASYVWGLLSQRLIQGVLYLLRGRLFRRLSGLGTSYFDREQPGQIAARVVNDIDQIGLFAATQVNPAATGGGQVLVSLIAILVLAPMTAPLVVGLLVAIFAVSTVQAVALTRAMDRARDHLGVVTARFEEDLTGTPELRNLGTVPAQAARFVQSSLDLRAARSRASWIISAFGAAVALLGNLAVLLVTQRAGNAALGGTLTAGTVLSLRVLTDGVTSPIPALTGAYSSLLEVRVSWHRLGDPFREPVLPVQRPGAVASPPLTGATRFDHVGFAYPGTDRPVLHDLSFALTPGQVTAVVGYTGAGKSSLSKLLTRMYDPDAGSVSVDGTDLRDLTLQSFRHRVGVVPQDAFVFRGTIASNIAYGRPDAGREQVEAAARAVGAHPVISAMTSGYDHPVEEAGSNLTAAQRQLVALARAWMTEPDLLILDEATSALDAELERDVLQAVRQLGCTTLTVTHRERVVAIADAVLVLDGGRLVQQGTPAEVLAEGGAFAALWATTTPESE